MNPAQGPMDFRGQLLGEVLPFWEAHGIDEKTGGYWTTINRDGSRYGSGAKYIVMQGRMIYSFCTGYRANGDQRFVDRNAASLLAPASTGTGGKLEHTYLDLAAQGVKFFEEHFYDQKYGGWFFATSREGEPLDLMKRPYGTAFAIYALAEYNRLSGDAQALKLAEETWDIEFRNAWDHERGGFFHECGVDWTPVNTTKRIDTMLHNMEGVSALYAATGNQKYLDAIKLLCDTIINRCWDPKTGCTHEWFYQDWREDLTNTRGLANYGHIVETAWFLAAVAGYTGSSDYLDFARKELDYALKWGWDQEHGGLYSYGKPEGGVVDTTKVWWMQSEFLDALAIFYRLTGEERYLDYLKRQAEYIWNGQRDPLFGEWYMLCNADGSPKDARKGMEWKAAYHVVQGLFQADRHYTAAVEKQPRSKDWGDWSL